jgi:CheY-like chemotaxis protein
MEPVSILLVEDDPADAELIQLALEGAGLATGLRVARDGAEALDFLFCRAPFAERPPDRPPRLVLLDLKLPKVSGLEVLRQLKRDPGTHAIPVVMLTSSSVERDVVEGYRLGANSYVQKPVEFERLRKVVVEVGRYWLQVSEPVPPRAFAREAE